jgi:hypothetical protein
MFPPSREKIEAAERYLEAIRNKPKGWLNTRHIGGRTRTGKPLWRNLPKEWHAEADAHLHRLVTKYWREHGHGPSQQKHASLIGNVVTHIRNCRITHHLNSMHWKYWNARKVASGGATTPNPFHRARFTPRTKRARSSQGNLAGI